MVVFALSTVQVVFADKIHGTLNRLDIHLLELLTAEFNVCKKSVAAVTGKVLPDDNTQHLEVVGVGRHGICGHDPSSCTQLVSKCKLIVDTVLIGRQAEGDQRKALAALLGHNDEPESFEGVGQVVGRTGQVGHDSLVALLTQANQLVWKNNLDTNQPVVWRKLKLTVLTNDLGGAFREV